MTLCLFLLFHWSKRQKTDVRASLSKTRRTFTLRSRWKKRPQERQEDGPVQQESKEFMNPPPASPILHCGPRREWCASSTPAPPSKEAQQSGLSSAGSGAHSVPRAPDIRWAGPPPPAPLASARFICSSAQLPAAAAPALPGARKAGIRCYHNKLNCSQQGPGK